MCIRKVTKLAFAALSFSGCGKQDLCILSEVRVGFLGVDSQDSQLCLVKQGVIDAASFIGL